MGKGSKRFRNNKKRRKTEGKLSMIASGSELGPKGTPQEWDGPLTGLARLEEQGELDIEQMIADLSSSEQKVIDALGRVNGNTYPDFLGNSAVIKPPKASVERRVTILKDTTLEFPMLNLSVFVEPDPAVYDDEARFARMFARSNCRRAKSVLEADLVVFGGGSDVDPALYGELPHKTTFFNTTRDTKDMDLYLLCVEQGIPMLGICRGAQFLSVMNGGKLYQDIDNHYGPHPILDIKKKQTIDCISSVHHQAVKPNLRGGMEIIATARKSNERWENNVSCKVGDAVDIEAFFYRDTCCIGIQGHPEYEGYHYFRKWSLDLIEELVCHNPDIEINKDGNWRLKQDAIAKAEALANLPKTVQSRPTLSVKEKK